MRRRHLLAGGALAALLPGCASPRQAVPWPTALTMGTGSPGGTYAVYGPGWGGIVQGATGINVAYHATSGPTENLLLLDSGVVQLGMANVGVARQAWEGEGDWTKGARLRDIRALFPMYDAPFQGVAPAGAGLTRFAQLEGRIVGVGEEGGTAGTYVPRMLAVLGVHPHDIRYGAIPDQVSEVADGRLDACVLAAGAPIPSLRRAERRAEFHMLGFAPPELDALRDAMPELSVSVLPRGTYRAVRSDMPVVSLFNIALCRADLPDDLAEAIVASVLAHRGLLMEATPAAAGTTVANAGRNNVLPWHQGAAAYYSRHGTTLASGR